MRISGALRRFPPVLALLGLTLSGEPANSPAAPAIAASSISPIAQSLTYHILWHGVFAGSATFDVKKAAQEWQTDVNVESAGLVSRLYRVQDKYMVKTNDRFCPSFAQLDAQEGKKHTFTRLTFDNVRNSVDYYEHDILKNSDKHKTTATVPCTHEIVGALSALSQIDLAAGKSSQIAVTDGKKMAEARIDALGKDPITIAGKRYDAFRYQAFLFDNVLYRRHGRLFVWVSDDADRMPVQVRLELGFPVGDVYLQLDKQQKF